MYLLRPGYLRDLGHPIKYLLIMEESLISKITWQPWNHQVVDVMVQKIQEDFPKMDINLILSNAVSAKNCLQNHNGFTPVQLVTSAHMRADNSERIKRALRYPVRSTEKFFEKGEKVMFKRDDNNH